LSRASDQIAVRDFLGISEADVPTNRLLTVRWLVGWKFEGPAGVARLELIGHNRAAWWMARSVRR
jgi:hypothetical protein